MNIIAAEVIGTAGIVNDVMADVINPNAEPYFYLLVTKSTGYQYYALTKDGVVFRRRGATDNRIRQGSYPFPTLEKPVVQEAIKNYVDEVVLLKE